MKHFTIRELTKSETARRLSIDNTPSLTVKMKLTALVDYILDPVRDMYGKPIVVNSGYRCEALNRAVGGAADSQHKFGEAADIEAASRAKAENRKIFELIRDSGLPFDQLINEYDYDWVHVSFGPRNRRQVLRAVKSNGVTRYVKE